MNRPPNNQSAGRTAGNSGRALATAGHIDFQANDVLLAFKHIGLLDCLNASEKQVAAFLVNSYNRKTGRCDPSLHTASVLLRKSERTIIRAIEKLAAFGLVTKRRHGGHNHCNSYTPNWVLVRSLEERFRQRQRDHSNRFAAATMSPSECHSSPSDCHPCHSEADKAVTQTSSINNIERTFPQTTYPDGPPIQHGAPGNQDRLSKGDVAGSTSRGVELRSSRLPQSSGQVARAAALRNWNNDLLRLRLLPGFAQMVEDIDPELESAATEAELKRRGSGLELIRQELARRDEPGGS